MSLTAVHGCPTAIVSAPNMMVLSTWLPALLGETEFADAAEANKIMGYIIMLPHEG